MHPDPEKTFVTCHDKDGNEREVPAADLTWRPSVYGVIVRDQQVLLTPCWDGWDFPGGGMDIHETLEQALVREVWEETGYTVERGELLGCFDSFFIYPDGVRTAHAMLTYYTCDVMSGEISVENLTDFEKKYGGKAQWIPLNMVHTLKFYNHVDSLALIAEAIKMGGGCCDAGGCCS
ncbi:MAG: NUDIX domain-containing protein [Patescibacteria group bacterium]